jgi:hypothetical protein
MHELEDILACNDDVLSVVYAYVLSLPSLPLTYTIPLPLSLGGGLHQCEDYPLHCGFAYDMIYLAILSNEEATIVLFMHGMFFLLFFFFQSSLICLLGTTDNAPKLLTPDICLTLNLHKKPTWTWPTISVVNGQVLKNHIRTKV